MGRVRWALHTRVCRACVARVGVACGARRAREVCRAAWVATCSMTGACMSTVATPYLRMIAWAWSCEDASVAHVSGKQKGAARPRLGGAG